MKKEVRQLREKAINSLVLSIEHFNRPWNRGRTEAVLILLDHSFEMLLKAAIRHRQGKIRKPREKQPSDLNRVFERDSQMQNLNFFPSGSIRVNHIPTVKRCSFASMHPPRFVKVFLMLVLIYSYVSSASR